MSAFLRVFHAGLEYHFKLLFSILQACCQPTYQHHCPLCAFFLYHLFSCRINTGFLLPCFSVIKKWRFWSPLEADWWSPSSGVPGRYRGNEKKEAVLSKVDAALSFCRSDLHIHNFCLCAVLHKLVWSSTGFWSGKHISAYHISLFLVLLPNYLNLFKPYFLILTFIYS